MLVLREIGLKPDVSNDHEKIKSSFGKDGIIWEEGFKDRVKKKAKEIMIDEELRRRRVQKMTMIAEGAEAKRAEDALAERKRKAEEKERWEGMSFCSLSLSFYIGRKLIWKRCLFRESRRPSNRLEEFLKRFKEEKE
jgi:hypothetical protein